MSRSDEADVELCGLCRRQNIDIDNFIVGPSRQRVRRRTPSKFPLISSTALIRLGTLEDIAKRHSAGCNFCGLVLASARTSPLLQSKGGALPPDATCHMRWEVDGRRMGETRQTGSYAGTERGPGALTRRIRLEWSHEDLEYAYLVAVAEERFLATSSDAHRAWSSESLFLGRLIDNGGSNQARLRSWIDLCKKHHPRPCDEWWRMKTPRKFLDMLKHSYFGVIDVVNMQLVQLPTFSMDGGLVIHSPYAALSYMWGKDDQSFFRTTKKTVNTLRMHGGLEKFRSKFPRVIQDAIDLVRRLDLQYIWIDALCIIQDSDHSWRLNAYNMDIIYGNAEVTICAAEGNGADGGLKAASPSATSNQPITAQCGDDLELMLVRTPESYIKSSTWNTRAWTFQERLMSRRCLIFVDGRVFFQCRSTGMSEDIYADRDGTGWSLDLVDAPMQTFKQISERSFWVYLNIAELYSSRSLTKEKDILAAFWGITTHMKRVMQAPFVLGLPSSHFDLAILWQHTGPASRREPTNAEELLEYAEHRFPTWSWTGWKDSSITYSRDTIGDCLENTSEWLTNHTWIRWHVRDGTGDLRPLWDSDSWRIDGSKDDTWRGYGFNRTSGAQIPRPFTERRKIPISRTLHLGEGVVSHDQFTLYKRSSSPQRAFTASMHGSESGSDETSPQIRDHRPYSYRVDAEGSIRPESSITQAQENHETGRASVFSRDTQLQRYNDNHSLPPPPPTSGMVDNFDETRSQHLPKQQLTRKVTFDEHVPNHDGPVNGEIRGHEMDGMRQPPQALSQNWDARSTGPGPNVNDTGRAELRPKYDEVFMPDEKVEPSQTESNPQFFISPSEYPYPPVVHPYNRQLDSDRSPLMPLLQFWTWHSELNIATRPKEAQRQKHLHEGLQRCDIADENGDWCGSIVLRSKWVNHCQSARQEFIAVSEAKTFSELECESWTYYIPKERHESEWDVFYVLLIERKDEEWERVGLGKIFKEAFMRTAQWKEIMLG